MVDDNSARSARPDRTPRPGGRVVRKRVYLTFPTELIKQPVVCDMYDRYKVRFSIRTASVSEEIGIIGLELEGEDERVQAAMAFFRERGIRVEPIELDVVEG